MEFKKQLCARILSEANDLKRTIPALATDLEMDVAKLHFVLSAEAPLSEIYDVIDKMGQRYPIDRSDLYLLKDDSENCVKIMRAQASEHSGRICERADRFGARTPYYEYRDTAMSTLAPFKPEWIKQLRIVSDADPKNSDVIYNNGHFMHQTTFFVGPVNFYWEIEGKRFCQQMKTGDSNYITPYWKHSFTSRDPNEQALILAITFGGAVRYAQKEFYALKEKSKEYRLDYRNAKRGIIQLIKQHRLDENLSIDNLNVELSKYSSKLKAQDLLDEEKEITTEDLQILAQIFNVEVADLCLAPYRPEDEVVVTTHDPNGGYYFPNDVSPMYHIYRLARTSKMPQMKGFNIEVIGSTPDFDHAFKSSTHTYAYNYSQSACRLIWEHKSNQFEAIINPGDSFYVQPFVPHVLCVIDKPSKIYMARVPGSIHLATQRELSFFSDIDRVVEENTCWFN